MDVWSGGEDNNASMWGEAEKQVEMKSESFPAFCELGKDELSARVRKVISTMEITLYSSGSQPS